MAAVLKKRAMAEYSHSNTQVETIQPHKKLRLTKKAKKESHKEKTSEKLSVISASVAASVPSVKSLEYFISNCSNNESSVTFEIVKLFENVLKENNASANIISLCEKLISIIKDEKDEILKASLVRIFKEILCFEKIEEYLNFTFVIEELLSLIAIAEGKITIAEILDTIHRILENHPIIPACDFSQQLINATKHLLMNNNSHLVKRQSLRLLSELAPISSENTNDINMPITQMQSKCTSIIKLLRDFSHYFDPRVRNDALSTILRLHDRGLKLDFSLYSEFCVALNDDYEGCRMTAMKLLEVLSHLYSDCLVCVNQGDEQIRLVDDAFAKICSMMNDSSIAVRTEAATLLGNISEVSFSFLSQTLNKTLMSNLRKKKSAHERSRESYSAGEWSSGRKWADDAPHEELCPDTINLMDIGACGAFIHGLEDEFMEVRMATLEALCKLAIAFPQFAEQSMDFVVDMFNDEIEDIRLKAIQCLSKISQQKIVLRGDQIEIILSVLEDSSIDIREALHEMLGNCKISTKEALKSCIENLIENLKKYSEDRNSIWKCFQKLGANHAELTLPLVPELLGIHPFLDLTEPSLEDITHIAILILVFNAAEKCPDITKVFVRHTIQHYVYLRDYYSSLVPNILSLNNNVEVKLTSLDLSNNEHNSAQSFLFSVFERIGKSMASERMNLDRQTSIIELLIRDLQRLGKIEPMMSHASDFLKQYLECQMALRKILSNNNWINAFLLSSLQSSSFRSSLQQILQTTFALVHQFHGMHPLHLSLILQTRVKALALQLIAVIHGSNASALTLCDAFLEEVKTLERHLVNNQLKPDALVESMLREIGVLEHPKPGSVARALQPLFLLSSTTLSAQTLDLTELVRENTFSSLKEIKKSSCTIDEPKGRSENPLKFTAGLILTIKLDAVLYNIKDIKNVRLKIHYPDQQTHFILPRLSDFRPLNSDNEDTKNYRLYTNVYISHGVWTEAAYVDICLVLDFREKCSHLTVSQSWTLKSSASVRVKPEESLIIELCKPVKICISPKQQKKALCA
ncbi:integrator complex subunit-like protein [Leptotrombidium deliense]|uniref:Integrator complex subunit-like protein n=1 Tax=Leptotrombidium deliense TaxID=299467 RepID=A0A443SWU1_9ACAR|nr:integrator complex subunit-like protein [Leptotrombidium deliense]